ncbi:MAG: Hpt domain-containing protein [Caldilineaceae bacterium]|nr:Hpt domain-containing protein [Caldilineaceae bacterium]HRJ41889.1 Hpt domain-containing protein [Caldilineaceae bacterium]
MSEKNRHIPLNPEIIQTYVIDACGGDREIVLQMVDYFLESSAKMVGEMKVELAADNLPAVYRAAHSLKSSAKMFSAEALSNLCAQTEESALQKLRSEISLQLPELQRELERISVELPIVCRQILNRK